MHNWLTTEDAREWLNKLEGEKLTPMLAARLRKDLPAEKVSLLVEQITLRDRGARKFTKSSQMLFTGLGLEQATDELIAKYKANRFATANRVVDICSGIGGDLTGFASCGLAVKGVDRNSTSSVFGLHNAKLYGDNVETICEDASAEVINEADAWHADPDRRVGGKRSIDPNLHEPSLEQLVEWHRVTPNAAIKLAPATRLPEDWQQACELEWISRGNECKQLVAWSGSLSFEPGIRTATKVESSGESASYRGEADLPINWVSMIGNYLYEPDPAILAGHLIGSIAGQNELSQFSASKAYLTSDSLVEHQLLSCFKVEAVYPFQRKRLASELHQSGVGSLELKCRGLDINLPVLRKKLKLKGSNKATLVLTPEANNTKKPMAILCHRIPY